MKKSLEMLDVWREDFVSRDMKEKLQHGDKHFRMSVHMTRVPSVSHLVLYSHWHEELELLFLEKGTVQFYVGQDRMKVKSGEIVLIPPNMLHFATRLDREEIAFCAVLVHYNFLSSLENDHIQQQYISPLFLQRRKYPLLITQDMDSRIRLLPVLEEIRGIYEAKNTGYELLIKAKLFEIVSRLQCCVADPNPEPDASTGFAKRNHNSSLAIKILAYVQQNYYKRITLADMARQANMNPSYFCRFVKKQFDMSPMDFLNQYRLSEAITLMETTDKKITEISNLTGFRNVNRFTDTFKKFYGCTPLFYRNAIRNNDESAQLLIRRDTKL